MKKAKEMTKEMKKAKKEMTKEEIKAEYFRLLKINMDEALRFWEANSQN